MGQYFRAINCDKREVVCPWCLGGGAKLWEWSANRQGNALTLLLRKSDEGGGGDFLGDTYESDVNAITDRWAGDRIMLIGDYDSSKKYEYSRMYRNISRELVEAWNPYLGLPEYEMKFDHTCTCGGD